MKNKLSLLLLSLIMASSFFSSGAFALSPVAPFSDIIDATYRDGVYYLQVNGLIEGYHDKTFKPENTVNRAEMIKIIVNGTLIYNKKDLSSIDSYGESSCFSDVPANQWFTKYVCYAKAQGWVVGYENGTLYKPGQLVPFVEGLKMTMKSFNLEFVEGDPWFVDAVDKASEKNYIPLTISGFYNNLLRGEMADMIVRMIKDNEGTLSEYLGDRAGIVVDYTSLDQGINLSNSTTANTYKKLIQIFFVSILDNGLTGDEIGCGGTVESANVYIDAKLAGDYLDDIESTLNYLLSIKKSTYKETGLYNALSQSDLTVTQVIYDELNNSIEVNLTGNLISNSICDDPLIKAQLKSTVDQFGDFDDVTFTVDYEGLDELLNLIDLY